MTLLEMLQADRVKMLPQVRNLCEEVDAGLYNVFTFAKPKRRRKKVKKVDGRKFPVQFKVQGKVRTPEVEDRNMKRLLAIEEYRRQTERGEEIKFNVNDNNLHMAQLEFAAFLSESLGIQLLKEEECC